MACRASAGWGFLGCIFLLLAGCDNTTVAFCSGSDEFCSNFFSDAFSDEDEDEDDPPEAEPEEVTAALTIARAVPDAVTSAIDQQAMAQLTLDQPDLVGFWLIASTLGHLTAPDDVAITQFLDRNRAWITPSVKAVGGEATTAGLGLLGAFATQRDPALAELAQSPDAAISKTMVDSVVVSAQARATIINAPGDPCCTATLLAAAAISMCAEAPALEEQAQEAAEAACAVANRWWAAHQLPVKEQPPPPPAYPG